MRRNKCQISGYSCMPLASFLAFSDVHGFGWLKRVKIGFMAFCLCLAVFSLLWSPSSASAYGGIGDFYYGAGAIDRGSVTVNENVLSCPMNGSRLQCKIGLDGSKVISGFSIDTQYQVPSNSVMRFNIIFRANKYPNFSPAPLLVGYGWNILSQDWVIVDPNTAFVTVEVMRTNSGSYNHLDFVFNGSILVDPMTAGDSLLISFSNYTYSTQIDAGWYVDSLGKIESIESYAKQIATGGIKATVDMSSTNNAINQNTTAVNNASNQAHKDSQAQLGALDEQNRLQEEQNKQEQDRYEQDKQEESDRENQGSEDADAAKGIFNFGVANPFAGFFALFSPANTCASIPTLARWVHSDTITVCSWWSADVRTILTPVFGISSMMLLFGFVMRWLGGSEIIEWSSSKNG